jgi:hypothetical protein
MAQPDPGRVRLAHPLIPVVTFGFSLSLFLTISYVLCVVGYLLLPGLLINHSALAIFLPGFELGESFAWGWYVALVFAPLFNFFAAPRG